MTDGPADEAEPGTATELAALGEIVAALRLRCPWDREQTHHSLVRHLLEEAHEAIEAIDGLSEPPTEAEAEHLREQLGDVLFQVYFHSLLASEEGLFDLGDVARATREKLVARHPHVFGDRVAADSKAVLANWERGKLDEKGRTSLMDGIPAALPALAVAAKVERKAAGAGLGADVTGEPEHLPDLLAALTAGTVSDEQLGELLLGIGRLAAHEGHDPEAALRHALARFRSRFVAAEDEARATGSHLHEIDPAERVRMWHRC